MTLRAQLVQTEIEERNNFATYLLGSFETLGEKFDSCNHFFIRLDHSLLSEKLLKVVWQLGSTSIVWVHGNEDTHLLVQLNITSN
jgi:hypothetical protein